MFGIRSKDEQLKAEVVRDSYRRRVLEVLLPAAVEVTATGAEDQPMCPKPLTASPCRAVLAPTRMEEVGHESSLADA